MTRSHAARHKVASGGKNSAATIAATVAASSITVRGAGARLSGTSLRLKRASGGKLAFRGHHCATEGRGHVKASARVLRRARVASCSCAAFENIIFLAASLALLQSAWHHQSSMLPSVTRAPSPLGPDAALRMHKRRVVAGCEAARNRRTEPQAPADSCPPTSPSLMMVASCS